MFKVLFLRGHVCLCRLPPLTLTSPILSALMYHWNSGHMMWYLSYCSFISQERLPEARVVYCSATGASEPRNLGYMVRLGLWGDGTSFLDFREFLGSLSSILFLIF